MLYTECYYKVDFSMPTNDWLSAVDKNSELVKKIDNEAKNNNELLYRFIHFPYADGYATYQITKVNKKTVRIESCKGLGDDWVIPYFGECANVDKDYILQQIKGRDRLIELLEERRK